MSSLRKKTILLSFIIPIFILMGVVFSISPNISHAESPEPQPATGYQPLAPLPPQFFPGQGADKYLLPSYLSGMFKILIAVSGLLAVVMIVIGGIEYMSTDAISGKSEGKEKITNAVLGLLLALVSWLILYTINPKLLEFNLNATNPVAPEPAKK